MDLEPQKRALRQRMLARRRSLSLAACERAGRAARDWITAEPEFEAARLLVLYAAVSGEVETQPLFASARAAGKRLCMPRCVSEGRLEFAEVDEWAELRPGAFGILEPPASARRVACDRRDLVIVPGVAFDREGRRLGRGGGYYDRAFPAQQADAPRLFGLAHAFQVVAEVPSDCHDRRMDAVCTEMGLLRAHSAGERA